MTVANEADWGPAIRVLNAAPYRGTNASTALAAPPSTLDLAAVQAALAAVGPDPLGEWMREKGFPPESSLLFLPPTMRDQLPFWPSYVRFSIHASAPIMCKDPSIGVWG